MSNSRTLKTLIFYAGPECKLSMWSNRFHGDVMPAKRTAQEVAEREIFSAESLSDHT
jgi:hypothetical protein